MSFTAALQRELTLTARLAFEQAWRQTLRDLENDPATPEDTRTLKNGFSATNKVVTGQVFGITISSTARGFKGVDYPAILENAGPRISAKRAKNLTFKVGGQFVSKPFIENRHDRWWTRAWKLDQPPTLWDTNMRRAFERAA